MAAPTVSLFDGKNFNAEVFEGYVNRIPNTKRNELINSRAIRPRPDLVSVLSDQVGGNYITTNLTGNISGEAPQNYDGTTNMTPGSTVTFRHSRVVTGRMKSWVEKDFSYDITGGQDFIENIAQQIADYWTEVDQDTLVNILAGVFAMSDAEGKKFVAAHTTDVSGNAAVGDVAAGCMGSATLNTAMQRACGDNKSKFSLVILHSSVATNLENLKLITYLKYNDANGMQRDLGLGTLNGRLVLIDDSMPTKDVAAKYVASKDKSVQPGKTYFTKSGGSEYKVVSAPVGDPSSSSYYEMTDEAHTLYTSYVLGEGAIEYTDCGAKVPYEVHRDPNTNGGQDTLYSRQRKCYAPYGISFTMKSMASLSPEPEELADGQNWELVNSGGSDKKYIDHKAIPIARIISRG